jgi:hypothetical protein
MTHINTKVRAIRLSITPEVGKALKQAKHLYPTLSDPEILKLGLSKIVTEDKPQTDAEERREVMQMASYAVGQDYLSDPEEDLYTMGMGKKVNFS